MKVENSKCLVLNADFSPLGIIGWKKALVWSVKYEFGSPMGVDIIDFYKNDFILGVNNKKHPIPAVIKTNKYFKLHNQRVNFSRKNLLIRDHYSCQYCGSKKNIKDLTYDHVIPKSQWQNNRGSPTCWTNIVIACVDCNRKKANKTPKQANMPLLSSPVEPNKSLKYLPVTHHLLTIRSDIPEEWLLYLPAYYQ